MKFAISIVFVILTVSTVHAAPSLFFDKADLPKLRDRAQSAKEDHVWKEILASAERLCSPDSDGYADPDRIDEGGGNIRIRAHRYGRRLTMWMETLGFAYQLTGEDRFGRHGARILVVAARKLPVTNPSVSKSFAGARGDLMRGFAIGLDWLGEAMTLEERRQVEEVAAGYVENILAEAGTYPFWMPDHNFMGVAMGAAGMLSLKLKDQYPEKAPPWIDECAKQISSWIDHGFDEQGAYGEGTLYANYGLTNAVRFADSLLRAGGPDLFDHARLRKVPQFFVMSLLPGETVFDARNDAPYVGFRDPFMLRLADKWNDGLAKWLWVRCGVGESPMRIVWANDVEPVPPAPPAQGLSTHFEGRGLCVWRTGWNAEDVMFSVEAGPYDRCVHDQADKGHFTLYGLGERWAIDSGYGNNQDPLGRAQTVAHNCILIDGKGQALTGAGLGTKGKILDYEDHEHYGYALADCAEAYNHNSRGTRGVGVMHARRHMLFVRPSANVPPYAVVLDDIRKDDHEHDYTWLLHTRKGMNVMIQSDGAVLRPVVREQAGKVTPRMRLVLSAAESVEYKLDSYDGHPRLNATVRAANPEFVAVLLPLPRGLPAPQVSIRREKDAVRVEVAWPSRLDIVMWPRKGECKPSVELR